MGNARWTGVRLRDLLDRVGINGGAIDVAFGGLDRAAMPGTPNFIKALELDQSSRGRGHGRR